MVSEIGLFLQGCACWRLISQSNIGFNRVVKNKWANMLRTEAVLMPSLERERKQPKSLSFILSLVLSLALPGSRHGAVPSQLTVLLAGLAPEDYERHYKV